MAIENGYLTLQEFKDAVSIERDTKDSLLELAIGAASRSVDKYTDRVFYASAAETRYFDSSDPRHLYTDDFTAITSIAQDLDGDETYETTWLVTDYELFREGPEYPYNEIRTTPFGLQGFSSTLNSIAITGDWGWETPPDDIKMATLLLAQRLWKRKDTPFGIVGSSDFGQLRVLTRIDPDVRQLLRPYRRLANY